MKAYIGISIDSKSTSGSDAVAAVLLGAWYKEIDLDAVFDTIFQDLEPEHFPSLKDPEIGSCSCRNGHFSMKLRNG